MIDVGKIYDITFELESQEVDEDGELRPPRMVQEVWKNAIVIAILENGNVILRRPTGIKNTWPRLEEIQAAYLKDYHFQEITCPQGV